MTKYIDGEKLAQRLEGSPLFDNFGEDGSFIKEFILELIKMQPAEDLHATRTELTRVQEENERLKSVEFTCGFVKPHKVLECPIFDEIEKAKADTVNELQTRVAVCFGTYTDKDTVKVSDVFKLIDQIAKEMLETTE